MRLRQAGIDGERLLQILRRLLVWKPVRQAPRQLPARQVSFGELRIQRQRPFDGEKRFLFPLSIGIDVKEGLGIRAAKRRLRQRELWVESGALLEKRDRAPEVCVTPVLCR